MMYGQTSLTCLVVQFDPDFSCMYMTVVQCHVLLTVQFQCVCVYVCVHIMCVSV